MFTMLRSKKGFTMVELMVVAIIVAILAAVVVPLMTGNKNRAYATEAVAALGSVRNALRVYSAEHGGSFPVLTAQPVEGNVAGISTGDLTGTFFSGANYAITSTAAGYTITCTWNAGSNTAPRATDVSSIVTTTTLNQNGIFGGTY